MIHSCNKSESILSRRRCAEPQRHSDAEDRTGPLLAHFSIGCIRIAPHGACTQVCVASRLRCYHSRRWGEFNLPAKRHGLACSPQTSVHRHGNRRQHRSTAYSTSMLSVSPPLGDHFVDGMHLIANVFTSPQSEGIFADWTEQ